jgi:TonB family protein
MIYFTVKEFLIPTLNPVTAVDTKFAVSIMLSAKQFKSNPEKSSEDNKELPKQDELEQEQKELEEKLAKEKKALEEKQLAEKREAEEKLKIEAKKAEEKLAKEKKEIEEKQLAEKREAEEKRKIEAKKAEEKLAKEKKALEERQLAEKREAEERQRQIEMQTAVTEALYEDPTLNNPPPKYPIISKKEGEEGEVILLVRVNPNGEVTDVILYKSSGYERLDNSSMYAVKSWKFIPAKNKFGGGVESVVKIPFVFKIK